MSLSVFKMVWKVSSKYLQNIFKISSKCTEFRNVEILVLYKGMQKGDLFKEMGVLFKCLYISSGI